MKTDSPSLAQQKRNAIAFAIHNTPHGPDPELAPPPTYGPGPELKADLEAPKPVNQSTGGLDPGEYTAEGDPYVYTLDNDGSVYARLPEESGPGAKLDARQKSVVVSQVKSGQLKRGKELPYGKFETSKTAAPPTVEPGFEKKPVQSMSEPEKQKMGWALPKEG